MTSIWIISAIISFVIALVICLARDIAKIKHDGKIDHQDKTGTTLKGALIIPAIVFFVLASDGKIWWAILFSWLMVCAWFLLLFDGVMGLILAKDFWFTGTEDGKEDATTDNFFQSIPRWLHIAIKLLLVIATTYVYISLL